MRYLYLFICICLCSSCPLSHADMYSWVDKNGTKHFSDTPPPESVINEALTPVKEIIKFRQFSVPVFKVITADDPGIVGTYIPISSTHEELPRYQLKGKKAQGKKKKVPRIFATTHKGNWQWKIRTGYSSYTSDEVPEGTPVDKVNLWRKKYEQVSLVIKQETIETSRKMFEYSYQYDLTTSSPNIPEWQKFSYKIYEHPELKAIGEYHPVSWSSPSPRYRSSSDMCLIVQQIGGSWQWTHGECELSSYSSRRLSEGILASEVDEWIQNAGYQIVLIKIDKI